MFSNLTIPTQPQNSNLKQAQNYFSGAHTESLPSDEKNTISLYKVKRKEETHPVTGSITFATSSTPMNINVSRMLQPVAPSPPVKTLSSCVLEKFFSSNEKTVNEQTVKNNESNTVENNTNTLHHGDLQTVQYIPFMNIDLLWQCYAFYAVVMGLATLLIPYYVETVALLMCPLFSFVVACHGTMGRHTICLYMSVLVVMMYPIVFLYHRTFVAVPIAYYLLFLMFIGIFAFFERYQRFLWVIIGALLVGSFVGIIVYYVYPKSIHGIHATAMALTVLTCTTLFFSAKRELSLNFRFCKQS